MRSTTKLITPAAAANEALYLAMGFPIGLTWFVLFVTLLSMAVGLMPILVGLAVLVGTLRLAGACASFERRLIGDLLDRTIEPPERCPALNAPDRPVLRLLGPITDGSYWRELLFLLLRLFLGIGAFVILVVLAALPVAAVLALIVNVTGSEILGVGWSVPRTIGGLVAAALIFVLGPTIVWAFAQLHGLIGHYPRPA